MLKGMSMTTMARMRSWQGPALLSYGFRPFFLLAGIYAALLILLWVPWFLGLIALPSALPPVAWHAHELLFGFLPAVIAGFLLTAVPNWTGRLPVVGWPLGMLVALWLLGRLAVFFSLMLPPAVVAAAAIALPLVLELVIGREIVAGRNWCNLKILVILTLLIVAQALFHIELWRTGAPTVSVHLAIAVAIMLIMIVGGRIIPSFTTNWLRQRGAGRQVAPFSRFDSAALILSGMALAGWVALSFIEAFRPPIAGALFFAGFANLWRQVRWGPLRTFAEPLVAVLHLAYSFIGIGFLFAGLSAWSDDAGYASAAIHAWTTGAIGAMTLAVMTRATRGHTGRPLTAPPGTVAIYAAVTIAAAARIAAALRPEYSMALLPLAGFVWCGAVLGFAALYGPMLTMPRR
jgi:uncharacterized protein involved in response to NO